MTTTHTPGAASELLTLEQIEAIKQDAERWIAAVAADGSMAGAAAQAIRNIIAGLTFIATPPAPVMEGAQREAVARDVLLNLVAAVTAFTADNGPTQCNLLSQAMRDARRALWIDPPPPDRVQPERGDGPCTHCDGSGCPYCHGKGWVHTPPTDARGGVTEALRELVQQEEAFARETGLVQPDPITRAVARAKSALEAADRARKPVDASAQAASARKPVDWG